VLLTRKPEKRPLSQNRGGGKNLLIFNLFTFSLSQGHKPEHEPTTSLKTPGAFYYLSYALRAARSKPRPHRSQCSKWRPQRLHRPEKFIGDGDISGTYRGYFQKSDVKIGL